MTRISWIGLAVVGLVMSGCTIGGNDSRPSESPDVAKAPAAVPKPEAVEPIVKGTVSYRERMALPDDAEVGLWIMDVTPGIIVAQADGCAPIVKAHREGADRATPWPNPQTHAAGLRVPGPLGDRLVLRAMRDTAGDAGSASEDAIREATKSIASLTGIDAAPEGGCGLAVLTDLVQQGRVAPDAQVVLYNTGSGASYRS